MSDKPLLNNLSPAALKAAMKGGTAAWGQWGSASDHQLYVERVLPSSRRRCLCGCENRATHLGMANGVALISGCEMAVQRWLKENSRPIR